MLRITGNRKGRNLSRFRDRLGDYPTRVFWYNPGERGGLQDSQAEGFCTAPVTSAPVLGGYPLTYLSGLLLGFSMILPIGPQNVFVLNQGLQGHLRRGLLAAFIAGLCDTTLILIGAAGLSVVFSELPWLRNLLLVAGMGMLLWLGFSSLRDAASTPGTATHQTDGSTASILLTGVAVSWGNPHAILDTVVVLGSAITAQQGQARVAFASGAVSASWLFFLGLALAGAGLSRIMTVRSHMWVRRISGIIMILFALQLGRVFLQAFIKNIVYSLA